MSRSPFRADDGPAPHTTPAARANRMGSPSLARMLAIVGIAALAAVAVALSFGGDPEAPGAGGLTTAAPPTGAGPNPDGEIDSLSGGGDPVDAAETAPPEGAVAPGAMGGVSQGPSEPDAPRQTPD